jgi:hypothetical protein
LKPEEDLAMGEINILHLSDIHFKRDKNDDNPIPLIGRGIYRRRNDRGHIPVGAF